MDESKEAGSEFIEAGGNPPELLKLEEEGFHKMAFLVEPPIDIPRIRIIFPRRDTEIRVVVGDELTELPLAIGPVGENLYIRTNGLITTKQVVANTRIGTQQGASAALNRLMCRGLIEKQGSGHNVYYVLTRSK